jgi:hypothetical protein
VSRFAFLRAEWPAMFEAAAEVDALVTSLDRLAGTANAA